jgi:enoyl-CoA hydratase/carnithine racemase
MSVGIDAVDQLEGIAIVRLHARPDPCELADVVACWRSLQADRAVRAVAVVSIGENFSAAVLTDAGDPMTIAPKSSGLLKPFGVALRGEVFDYALQLVGDADTVIATSDARIGDTNVRRGVRSVHAAWLIGSLPDAEINRLALLGPSNAMTALRAAELGLVDEIVDLDALEGALVRRLVRFSSG